MKILLLFVIVFLLVCSLFQRAEVDELQAAEDAG